MAYTVATQTVTLDDQVSAGAKAATDALNKLATASDQVVTSIQKVGPSAQALVSKLDPATKSAAALSAAQAALQAGTERLNAAVAGGTVSQSAAAGAIATLEARVAKLSGTTSEAVASSGNLSYAVRQSTVEATKFFSAIAQGAPISEVFLAQGRRLIDVTEETGVSFGQLATAIGQKLAGALAVVATPMGLAVTAAVALGAGITGAVVAAQNAAARFGDLQQGLTAYGQSAATVIAVSNSLAKTTDLSRSALDALGKSLVTGIPNFSATGAQLKNLEVIVRDFSSATGQSLEQATSAIKGVFGDPTQLAIKEAQEGLAGFNGEFVLTIQQMVNAGQTGAAAALVFDKIKAATAGAAAPTTDLGKAWMALKIAVDGGDGSLADAAAKLGTPLLTAITAITNAITALVEQINKLPGASGNAATALGVLFPAFGGAAAISALGSRAVSNLIPNTSGPISGPSASLPSPVAAQIQTIATQLGASQQAADFASRIAQQESGGNQYNSTGGILTSPTGNLGVMQLGVGTARDLGVDPTNASQNIAGGITYAVQMLNKYGGNEVLAAAAYNWGPGNLDKFLSGLTTTVPAETQKYTLAVTGQNIANLNGPLSATAGALPTAGQTPADLGFADAGKAATYANDVTKAQTAVTNLTAAQAQLASENKQGTPEWDNVTQALTLAQAALGNTLPAVQKITQPVNDNAFALISEAQAWKQGAGAAQDATIAAQAATQARTVALPGTVAYGEALAAINLALEHQAAAQQEVAAAQQLSKGTDQLAYLQAEVATLGESADARARDLAVLKEQQTIAQTMPKITDDQKAALIAQAGAVSDLTQHYQLMQSSLQAISDLATQAFDQIGSAISQAFTSGQGAAVNWGNVTKAVVASVIQEVAKLAILNPIINSISGANNPTLGSVLTAVSGAGGTSGGGSSAFSTLSNIGTVGSAANTLSGGSLLNALGITGPNGLTSSIGNLLPNSVSSLFSSGATVSAASSDAALANAIAGAGPINSGLLGSGGSLAGLANTSLGLGTATIGTALTGVGGGFGIGSLAGSLEQSALNKTGPAPTIGAGVGAVAGAAIGSVIPGVGTVIGGLVGGLIGGAGGGLIGPHPASSFSSTKVGITSGGGLAIGDNLSQLDPNNLTEFNQAEQDAATLNALLSQAGISLASLGGIAQLGDNSAKGFQDPSKAADLSTAFPKLRFSVNDTSTEEGADLAPLVNGQSFASASDLQAVFTEVDTFVNQTLPSLTVITPNVGSLQTAIDGLNTSFGPALTEANKLNDGVQALTDSYNTQLATLNSAVAAQVQSDQVGYQAQYAAAKAQISGSPADAESAALFSFDNITVPQARTQLASEYQGIFGDAYASTSQYVATSAALEQSLGEQRLAIQAQYNGQIASADGTAAQASAATLAQAQQTAASTVTSLLSYVQKLQGSDQSPLSPQAQYSLAQSQFNAVSGAATAGDFNSISNLPTYADALLSASRTVNGSGAAYASDYATVLNTISSVAGQGPDALTQSVFIATQQSSTAAIVTAIGQLQAQLVSLQTVVSQNGLQPSRIAA